MSTTSPEAEFYKIDNSNGLILWSDGHSVGAEAITEAIKAGMKHFVDVYEDGEFYIACSSGPLTEKDGLKLLQKWDSQSSSEDDE